MSVQDLRGGGGYRGMEGTSTTDSNATLNTHFSVNTAPHEVAGNSHSPNRSLPKPEMPQQTIK